jgi:hypothetical protein
MKVNLWRAERWEAEESAIKQPALFGEAPAAVVLPSSVAQIDSEITPPSAADVSNDVNEETENPGPGKPEAVVHTSAPKVKQQQPAPAPKRGGWSAKNW